MAEANYPLNDPRRKRRRPRLELNGSVMKIYGCVTMFFYSLSMSVIQNGLIHVNDFAPGELSQAMAQDPELMVLSGWGSAFQLIGGLAVPVFAFLLVQGFLHTSDYKRYLLTILAFAVVSEVPYDLCVGGTWWTMSGQNVMFTYAVCLVMLYGLRLLEAGEGRHRLLKLAVTAAAVLWCMLLRSAFGLCTVLLTAIYYLWRDEKGTSVMLGCAVSLMYVTAPLSGYAIYNYSGQRGRLAEKGKYLFYALYPVHLLALGLIARAM